MVDDASKARDVTGPCPTGYGPRMSEQPQAGPDVDDAGQDLPTQSAPLDERPPVAGGTDDGPPVQGEGEQDSL